VVHTRSGTARRVAAITAALAGIACLAAACSSPKSPAARSSSDNPATQALAYSTCMRSHGVPDFPDPKISSNGNGSSVSLGLHSGSGSDLNPRSRAFQAAQRDCRKLAPAGSNQQPPTAQDLTADVRFAACMRSHGFPSFPGPDGQGVFNLPGPINSNSPQFSSVVNTCQSKTHAHDLSLKQTTPGGGSDGGS
jgi:hypothetical protein